MHKGTVEMAQSKTQHKKLWTMRIGFGPKCAALLDSDGDPHPIYMGCTVCGLFLGSTEQEYAKLGISMTDLPEKQKEAWK